MKYVTHHADGNGAEAGGGGDRQRTIHRVTGVRRVYGSGENGVPSSGIFYRKKFMKKIL